MPQVVALALVGAGLWAGYRWFRREAERVGVDLKRAGLRRRSANDRPTLEEDPQTGVYKPRG